MLQSTGLQRVRHDLVTKQQIFLLASFKDVPDILTWVEILKNQRAKSQICLLLKGRKKSYLHWSAVKMSMEKWVLSHFPFLLPFLPILHPLLSLLQVGYCNSWGQDVIYLCFSKAPSSVPVTCRCSVFACRIDGWTHWDWTERQDWKSPDCATYELWELGSLSPFSQNFLPPKSRNYTSYLLWGVNEIIFKKQLKQYPVLLICSINVTFLKRKKKE